MVSVIILSYNTKDLLKQCLQAVEKKLSKIEIEIVVLDNASKDDSVAMIRREFPTIKLIESSKNLGFAKGVNRAAQIAEGEYFLFLNSDATLQDEGLKDMLDILEHDKSVGAIGGALLHSDGKTSESYGRFYFLPELLRLLFLPKNAKSQIVNKKTSVDWVSGGFMLIRASVFKKLGGFDEHFFMYIEDMELCYRLKKAGLKVIYYPEAKAKHVGQASSNRTFAIINIFKGISYFYKKHRSLIEYYIVKSLLMIKALVAIFIGIVSGNAYLRRTYKQALHEIL
jgi:GT2 family glycosyltransferase